MTEQRHRPAALAAARLRCTEGQVFTMVIGLVLALLLAVPGIPAVLRDRPIQEQAGASLRPFRGESSLEPAASTSSASPPVDAGREPPRRAPAPRRGSTPRLVAPVPGASPSGDAAPPSAPVAAVRTPGAIDVFARIGPPGAPGGMALGPDGTVVLTTDNGTTRGGGGPSRVFSFRADGTPIASRAITGQADDRPGGLTGAAVDPSSRSVAVLDPGGRRVIGIDTSSGVQSVLAEIPDLPACLVLLGAAPCQPGVDDRPPFPVSAVYDRHGDLLFTDAAQDTIWRLSRGKAEPEVWYQSPDLSHGDGPFGLAVHGAAIEFTVGASSDVATLGTGALYRLSTDDDGSAGDRSVVHAFARGERPGSLAVARSGTTYVVLRESGAIVTLAADGSERARLEPPGTGPVPLDAPSAVVLSPGALLVANGRTSADPARWAILTVAVDEEPTRAAAATSSWLRTIQRGKAI